MMLGEKKKKSLFVLVDYVFVLANHANLNVYMAPSSIYMDS